MEDEPAGRIDEQAPRLHVEKFLDVYRWVNENLPESIGREFDRFVGEELVGAYPNEAAALYNALGADTDRRLRAIAAAGLHNVMTIDPEQGVRLAARLLSDEDAAIAAQTRETLRDLPRLLQPESRHQREE